MAIEKSFKALDEVQIQALACALADVFMQATESKQHYVMYLQGELGAGKTTFSRYFLQSLGHKGAVKSPTYTLVEPYEHLQPQVYHFDLYRLADAQELEYMGIRDYFCEPGLSLIEWPDKGVGFIAAADIEITLGYATDSKRDIRLEALSDKGLALLTRLDFLSPKSET